jgi:hypothetical protein
MARKKLEDFNYDYQAYADYLESAQCLQDDGIDIYAEGRNVYTPTDGDWTKGHGHYVDNSDLNKEDYNRDANDEKSKGRPWYNKWLKYAEKLNLTSEEIKFLEDLYTYKQVKQSNELEENNKLSKIR